MTLHKRSIGKEQQYAGLVSLQCRPEWQAMRVHFQQFNHLNMLKHTQREQWIRVKQKTPSYCPVKQDALQLVHSLEEWEVTIICDKLSTIRLLIGRATSTTPWCLCGYFQNEKRMPAQGSLACCSAQLYTSTGCAENQPKCAASVCPPFSSVVCYYATMASDNGWLVWTLGW